MKMVFINNIMQTIENNTIAPVTIAPVTIAIAPCAADFVGVIGGKKSFVTAARAAGATRSDADRAFDLALAEHRSRLTARAGALIGSGHYVATSEKITKSGLVRYTFADSRVSRIREADKTAKKIAALEAKIAALKATA